MYSKKNAEDSDNIMQDVRMLENKASEDQERTKQYSKMVEHIDVFRHSDDGIDTECLEEEPENAKCWNNLSIQEIEATYVHLINPK